MIFKPVPFCLELNKGGVASAAVASTVKQRATCFSMSGSPFCLPQVMVYTFLPMVIHLSSGGW